MFRLCVQPLPGDPLEHLVEDGETVVVGRSAECGITLQSRWVSRRHATIRRQGDELVLEDLGSHNGTQLNGESVTEPTPVGPGDVIHVANAVITVEKVSLPPSHVAASATSSSSVFGSWRSLRG